MTIHSFSQLVGSTIGFDPSVDVISFDSGERANSLTIEQDGADVIIKIDDRWIRLSVLSLDQLFASNFQFFYDIVSIGSPGQAAPVGGPGNDYFDIRGGGLNGISTGAGDDKIVANAALNPDFSIDGGEGTADRLMLYGRAAAMIELKAASLQRVEEIRAGAGTTVSLKLDLSTVSPDTGSLHIDTSGQAQDDSTTIDGALASGRLLIDAGAGHDQLVGGSGDDRLDGGDGVDIISGGLGTDIIIGGLGGDTLTGGGGADVFRFGLGQPRSDSAPNLPDIIVDFEGRGGAGGDLLDLPAFSSGLPLTFNIAPVDFQFSSIGTSGTQLPTELVGDGFVDVVWRFNASQSRNEIWVDANDDGQFGEEDLLIYLPLTSGSQALAITDFVDNFPVIRLRSDPLQLDDFSGTNQANIIYALAGDDVVNGLGGNDQIYGGEGNDTLEGGSDQDTLHGEAGDDDLKGGEGSDYLIGGANEDTLHGGDDADTLVAGLTAFGGGDAATDINSLYGERGDDTLYGAEGKDQLFGGEEQDMLLGYAGEDRLDGGSGDDQLDGGEGDDELTGGTGSDRLQGGRGQDILSGGGQADIVAFGSGDSLFPAPDRVIDFNPGEGDRIELNDGTGLGRFYGRPLVFMGMLPTGSVYGEGMLLPDRGLDDILTQLWWVRDGGRTMLLADLNANYQLDSADFVVELSGTSPVSLAKSDFVPGSFLVQVGTPLADGPSDLPGSAGDDTIYAVGGNDVVSGLGGNDQIYGGNDDDWLDGGSDQDALYGEAGNDSLDGGDGADYLIGGVGSDALHGGNDADSLVAGLSALGGGDAATDVNSLFGEAGNDTLYGAEGRDQLFGGEEQDMLLGHGGEDSLDGGDGDDQLDGGEGDDELTGGAGSDRLQGGSGQDILAGGTDADILTWQSGDSFFPAPDRVMDLDPGEGDRIELEDGSGLGRFYGRPLVFMGVLPIGTIYGAGMALPDLGMSDILTQLWWVRDGGRTMLLADLNANYQLDSADFVIELSGTSPISLSASDFVPNSFLVQVGTRAAEGPSNLPGSANGDTIYALAGDDVVSGLGGNDLIYGGDENDRLEGGSDQDTLYGEAGNDSLDGGDGVDNLTGGVGSDALHGGNDADSLIAGLSAYGGGDAANDVNSLFGEAGNDTLYGAEGRDQLFGGEEQDMLLGHGGEDSLDGGDGDDQLDGGEGDDELTGGAGADRLQGSSGQDILAGGTDADIFAWRSGDSFFPAPDRVTDFNPGEGDRIELEDGSGLGRFYGRPLVFMGMLPTGTIYGNGMALPDLGMGDILTQLWWVRDGGRTILLADLNANYQLDSADFVVELSGTSPISLSASDFMPGSFLVKVGSPVADDPGNLPGSASDDIIYALAGDDVVNGLGGNDQIYGGEGKDTLAGGSDQDTLYGEAGDDTLNGEDGSDYLIGGTGSDTLHGGNDADSLVAGLNPFGGGDAATDVNSLYGEFGNDTLYGAEGRDQLLGGADDDNLLGNSGDDVLMGEDGDDQMDGGEGDDALTGGAGSDRLYGGSGQDILTGGTEADIFSWAGGNSLLPAPDRVTDFNPGEGDRIELNDGSGIGRLAGRPMVLMGMLPTGTVYGAGMTLPDRDIGDILTQLWWVRTGGSTILIADLNADYQLDSSDLVIEFSGSSPVSLAESDFASGSFNARFGTRNADGALQLPGTPQADLLYALAGDDVVSGLESSDTIYGGAGRDSLNGDEGDDTLYGEIDDDGLNGGDGNDTLVGGEGSDTLHGGNDADSLFAGAYGWNGADDTQAVNSLYGDYGDDTLYGAGGTDNLYGGLDRDTLYGSGGNDVLSGGDGSDILYGGEGDDYLAGGTLSDTLEGESGNDVVEYAAEDQLADGGSDGNGADDDLLILGNGGIVNLANATDQVDGGGIARNFESVDASSSAMAVLLGGDGRANRLTGGSGNDQIAGEDGNDVLAGSSGADELLGGDGDDQILYDGADMLAAGGMGQDLLILAGAAQVDLADPFDQVVGGGVASGFEHVDASLAAASVRIAGDDGANRLSGGQVADMIAGGDGDDLLAGNGGDDRLDGGGGDDRLEGGAGSDLVLLSGNRADYKFQLLTDAAGRSFVRATDLRGAGFDGIDRLYDVEHVQFADGTVSINALIVPPNVINGTDDPNILYGTAQNDIINGFGGADILRGEAGDDIVDAGDGDDYIDGGTGDDMLLGGAGDDILSDELGTDTLDGGEGLDTVYLSFYNLSFGVSFAIGSDQTVDTAGGQKTLISIEAAMVQGTSFDDILSGGDIRDLLYGDNGNDILRGDGGNDYLNGQHGDDTIDGGAGIDRTDISFANRSAGITFTFTGNQVVSNTVTGADTLIDMEEADIFGTYYDDVITGSGWDDYIAGNGGSDILDGGAGNDRLDNSSPSAAGTWLIGGAGDDELWGEGTHTTAVLTGARSDYSLVLRTNGSVLVSDLRAGNFDGTDTLYGISHLSFAGTVMTMADALLPVNSPPTDITLSGAVVAENALNGTSIGTLLGIDPDANERFTYILVDDAGGRFSILGDQLVVADGTLLDFETASSHDIVVRVTDSASQNFEKGIAIAVANVNEAPTLVHPAVDQASDEDSFWQFQLPSDMFSDVDGDSLSLVATLGNGDPLPAWLNFDASAGRFFGTPPLNFNGAIEVRLVASDGALLASDSFTLTISPVNDAPFDLVMAGGSVAENSPNGTLVGSFAGSDPDSGEVLHYSLVDDAGGRFVIDAASGELRVADGSLLDFEAAASHNIIVRITDAAFATYDEAFVITITDVPETTRIYTGTGSANTFVAPTAEDWIVYGLGGNDRLTTLGGRDVVSGGAGNDIIATGANDDIVTFQGTAEGFDAIDGGAGYDRIVALSNDTIIGLSSIAGVEEISANGFANVRIRGSTASNIIDLSGISLVDIGSIDGDAGNDIITGSTAGDTLIGGSGNDQLAGGEGDDIFLVGVTAGTDQFSGGAGYDRVVATADGAAIAIAAISGIEEISGGGFANVRISGGNTNDVFDFSTMLLSGIALIDGGSGNDRIAGSIGDDVIAGGGGNDDLSGGDGNDLFLLGTGAGSDLINGGNGFDTIRATAANVSIGWSGLANIEAIDGNGYANVRLIGSSAADVINLTAILVNDIASVDGGAGNDQITGTTGADTIIGGSGSDSLSGGDGDDLVLIGVGAGTDAIDGGAGMDRIRASAANVTIGLSALAGIEVIDSGGFGNVRIAGTALADVLDLAAVTLTGIAAIDGAGGNDTISGTVDADTIIGGAGNDILSGGAGDDIFLIGTGAGTDVIDGGNGFDIIRASAANATIAWGAIRGIERIENGGFSNARIVGTVGADTIDVQGLQVAGTTVDGGAGSDTIIGTSDADTIIGGTGNDSLAGGDGDDLFLIDRGAGADAVDGGAGVDRILATAANVTIGLSGLAGIEVIDSGGFGNVRVAGTALGDVLNLATVTLTGIAAIDGAGGNDTISGTVDADTIIGGAGNDTLSGDAGDDIFLVAAGAGTDVIDGGIGFDIIRASAANATIAWGAISGVERIDNGGFSNVRIVGTTGSDTIDVQGLQVSGTAIDGGAGSDTIIGTSDADTIIGGTGNDSLSGGDGDDLFLIGGGAGTDIINGGSGADIIRATAANTSIVWGAITVVEGIEAGGFANVRIIGTAADDMIDLESVVLTGIAAIDGGAGSDTVVGSGQSDLLIGGAGNDNIGGGAGADIFDYNAVSDSRPGALADRILDFEQGYDRIDLSTIDANALLAGDQAFVMIGSAAFSGNRGEVRIDYTSPGVSRILVDLDGNRVADMEIQVLGSSVLAISDLIL